MSKKSTLFKLFIFFILSSFIQCRKDEINVLFKMEYDLLLNVPGGLNTIETYSFLKENLNTNFNTLASTYNLNTTLPVIIRPGNLRLTDQLDQIDFAKMEKISLLASKANFKDEIEIGYLEPVPLNSATTLQLFPTLVNAKDIFSGDKFNLRLKIKYRGVVSTSTNLRMQVVMNVANN